MSDLISRDIAIKELRKYADIKCNNGYIDTANGILTAMTWIKNMVSAVDAVEVVRCKDCIYCLVDNTERAYHLCMERSRLVKRVKLDEFCSNGERKEVSE